MCLFLSPSATVFHFLRCFSFCSILMIACQNFLELDRKPKPSNPSIVFSHQKRTEPLFHVIRTKTNSSGRTKAVWSGPWSVGGFTPLILVCIKLENPERAKQGRCKRTQREQMQIAFILSVLYKPFYITLEFKLLHNRDAPWFEIIKQELSVCK